MLTREYIKVINWPQIREYETMKKIIFLVLMFVGQFAFAQEQNVCGTVRNFSKHQNEQGTGPIYEIQFTNGIRISNVEIMLGEQALLASSITLGLKLCFAQDSRSNYEFSSAHY